MRAVIRGYDKEIELEMECFYLKNIPPIRLLWEVCKISSDTNMDYELVYSIGLKELIALEPYMVHKADIFKLGSQDYFLEFEE